MLNPHDLPTIKAALRIAAKMIGNDRTPYIELLLKLIEDETRTTPHPEDRSHDARGNR
jgi:hypothetical protein